MNSSPVKPAGEMAPGEPSLPPVPSSLFGSRKRPAPSLLPPFEPSSSPGLPRPLKRAAHDGPDGPSHFVKYPTPIPTSSTGILSSSPPHIRSSRPGFVQALSTASERAPLSAVPELELNGNGEVLFMGRSSNTSHYQLSSNRLVSRIHVKARYIPALSPLDSNRVEVECNGWNGLKLHCQGKTWDLAKGDTFTSETEDADIMIDVQDARVMVHWPREARRNSITNLSDSSWDDSPRPRSRPSGPTEDSLQLSPLRRRTRIQSPVSPTPANRSSASLNALLALQDRSEPVHIFEDASAGEPEPHDSVVDVEVSFAETDITNAFSSDLSDLDDDNDPDEENDPIIHSFGPFGADLSDRLAAIRAKSPKQSPKMGSGHSTAKTSAEPDEPLDPIIDVEAITNHVVNQLAFSRLSSNPLTAIMNNLPAEEKKGLSKPGLRRIIEGARCIGIIARQGKDAAGKALESEYYYMPEHDTDDSRRVAVTDGLRKPSLRACRKQHKQYYWKRPRTP
ncbi:putative transcription factor tos4 [Rosellinia necatrix]|uniref:Putative transcription factor tos4 n=1 Tax=Rosellinia necatrix TaxID=77044 RepID=A0A1W2TE30_ROSNE|nr:putative transcription factor tos4 [Rosellinia necatrix]